jgi:hypothetical protein
MPIMLQTRISLAAAVIAAFATLAGPLPAVAAEGETPSELAREGMERMLRAIELMIEMIPQYEVPEVLENGDIIIRRKNPRPDEEEEEAVDETRT